VLKETGGTGGLLSKLRSLLRRSNKNKKSEDTAAAKSVKAKSE